MRGLPVTNAVANVRPEKCSRSAGRPWPTGGPAREPWLPGACTDVVARVTLVLVVFALAGCQAPSVGTPTAPPTAIASATAKAVASAAPAAATGQRFDVPSGAARATIRIREQLITWSVPDDAILTLDDVNGSFAIRDDGTFDPASKLRAELAGLKSDDFRRASAARETMNAAQFPVIEFRPIRTLDLPLPLGASGTWEFRMLGALTVNGVERELEWHAVAERQASRLTAAARTSFPFGHFGMEVPRRGPVLSIVDEVRLEVALSASAVGDTSAECAATPQDVPANYVPDAPVRSRIGTGGYSFAGAVRSTAGCAPVPGARVEIWLADPEGRYDAEHRATVIADASGRYSLDTSAPAAYGGGPAHIHIRVTAERHRPLVAIFFPATGTTSGQMDLVLQPN